MAASAGEPSGGNIDVRLRALEGMSADHLHGLDQRLSRLEALPTAVSRIQEDLVLLADVGRAHGPAGSGAGPDLAVVYEELDTVAELVSAHHGAANQSLERVRTLRTGRCWRCGATWSGIRRNTHAWLRPS